MCDKEKDIEQLIYRELPPDRYCYIHNYIVDLKNQLQQKENIINELKERSLHYSKQIDGLLEIKEEIREKIENVQILGLRSGKTLIATLLNEISEILDKEVIKSE